MIQEIRKVFCDKCGNEVKKSNDFNHIDILTHRKFSYHVCLSCWDKVKSGLLDIFTREPQERSL